MEVFVFFNVALELVFDFGFGVFQSFDFSVSFEKLFFELLSLLVMFLVERFKGDFSLGLLVFELFGKGVNFRRLFFEGG